MGERDATFGDRSASYNRESAVYCRFEKKIDDQLIENKVTLWNNAEFLMLNYQLFILITVFERNISEVLLERRFKMQDPSGDM